MKHELFNQLRKPIPVADLSPLQNDIRRRFGRDYHRSKEALWEVAALWGITPEHKRINPHGVFDPIDEIIGIEAERSHIEIELAKAPNGLWAMAINYTLPLSGAGAAPSVWNSTAYFSRDDAREVALRNLLARFKEITKRGGADAKAATQLMTEIEKVRFEQMELF